MDYLQDTVSLQQRDGNTFAAMPILYQLMAWDFGGDRIFIYGISGGSVYCGWTCFAQIEQLYSYLMEYNEG